MTSNNQHQNLEEAFFYTYVTEQYDFFTNLGYQLIEPVITYNKSILSVQFFDVDGIKKLQENASNHHISYKIIDKQQLMEYSRQHKKYDFIQANHYSKQDQHLISFKIKFFCQYPEYRNILTEHTSGFLVNFPELINQLVVHHCDVLQVLLDIPPENLDLRLEGFNLDIFSKNLKKYFSQEKLYPFWISFLKMRPNQVNHLCSVHDVVEFLQNEYNKEKLEPFFEFIPFLKSQFYDVPLDIYEDSGKYNISFLINIFKIQQSVCIRHWESNKYKFIIETLVEEIATHFGCTQSGMYPHMKNNDLFNLYFSHSNEKLSEKIVKDHINSFLLELKNNPKMEASPENIRRSILYREMENDIKDTETTDVSKKTLIRKKM